MLAHTLLVALAISIQTSPIAEAVKANCIPLQSVKAGSGLQDMEALKTTLQDVQIVGMGEPTHGSREVFQMKHRMFEFLVTELGYTVFALEASMPDCVAMDRYVTTGAGDVNKAVSAQGFWTWTTEEVADLIKWMRKYNEDPAHKVKLRVVGVDMQNRFGAMEFLQTELNRAGVKTDHLFDPPITSKFSKGIEEALPKVREKFGSEHAELVKRVGLVYEQATKNEKTAEAMQIRQTVGPYLMETVLQTPNLLKSHTDLKGDALVGMQFLEKCSKTVYQPTEAETAKLRDYAKGIRDYSAKTKTDKQDFERCATILDYFAFSYENKDVVGINYRDMCMAQNLEWAIKTYLPGQKAMVWAHNMHVSRWEQRQSSRWMGAYLNDIFQAKYYPVGFSFYEGSFQAMGADMSGLKEWKVEPAPAGSLDAALNQAGPKQFFLDFGKLDEKSKAWFNEPRSSRSIGALYNPEYAKQYFMETAPAKLYSGMIFIAKTTRAKPLK
jgi:erythromycin esterase